MVLKTNSLKVTSQGRLKAVKVILLIALFFLCVTIRVSAQDLLGVIHEKNDSIGKLSCLSDVTSIFLKPISFSSSESKEDTISSQKVDTVKIVRPTHGIIDGHEWVDLGLSVRWATCNLGADSPSDYGSYYAWGETEPKESYTSANSLTYGKSMDVIEEDSGFDAANDTWGGFWRLPSKQEADELSLKCTHEWTTMGEHKGYKITGPNGNSIFLPAAGCCYKSKLYNAEVSGFYWTSTPHETINYNAYELFIGVGMFSSSSNYRYIGQSIRPVIE